MMAAAKPTNWLIAQWLPPRFFPKLDYESGIPVECRTMVGIPPLLSSANDVERLLQQLELHVLSNTDPHLHFALLSDFDDAPQKHMPGDDALVEKAEAGIQDLNRRYGEESSGPFLSLPARAVVESRRGLLNGLGD